MRNIRETSCSCADNWRLQFGFKFYFPPAEIKQQQQQQTWKKKNQETKKTKIPGHLRSVPLVIGLLTSKDKMNPWPMMVSSPTCIDWSCKDSQSPPLLELEIYKMKSLQVLAPGWVFQVLDLFECNVHWCCQASRWRQHLSSYDNPLEISVT